MEDILRAFIVGGAICLIGQLIMDLTPFSITPSHILVGFVVGGAVLSALGLYQPLIDIGGTGATIPLSGFGHSLAQGAISGAENRGILGVIGGGIEATAVGVGAAIIFGYLMAVIFHPQG
ncbi:stage V sporulation protein AE [Candidatus Formimonas warabiya]|uniref:Stage V sporulation protein AE n=1 Tax=Formimonas warabiya TaxID=1761012 RepID=A0A3G1KNT4_FORW1|nr:stage V sporulation protein AE [Candidatus Formimonas warabiya]ATW24080.1 stage V sporulation protein AE [Candidatus Formimonas warabiya]